MLRPIRAALAWGLSAALALAPVTDALAQSRNSFRPIFQPGGGVSSSTNKPAAGATLVTGQVPAGATATAKRNGTVLGNATVSAQGAASYVLPSPLVVGDQVSFPWTLLGETPAATAASVGGPVVPAPAPVGVLLIGTAFKANAAPGTVIGALKGDFTGATLALSDNAGGAVAISGTNLVVGSTATTSATLLAPTVRKIQGGSFVDTPVSIAVGTTDEAVSYFGRMTTKPAAAAVTILDTMIATVRASTAWAKLDWFYFLAGDTYQASLLNIVGNYPLMVTGSPVFAARGGITGASGASLSNNVAVSNGAFANYTQDSAHVGVYIKTAGTTTNPIVGMQGSSILQIQPKSASGNFGSRINNSTTLAAANAATRVGHYTISRTGPTAAAAYRNGGAAVVTNSTASAAITGATSPLYLFRDATAAVYSDDTVTAFHGGGGLTQAENQVLNDAITTATNAMAALPAAPAPSATDYDLVVYGGTLSGLMAAQRAANRGARVAIVEPTAELGGVGHHGLTYFDLGLRGAYLLANAGTDRFFKAINAAYGQAAPLTPAQKAEPKVYDQVFASTLAQTRATTILSSPLASSADVRMSGNAINAIRTPSGWVTGRQFVDASYELDLAAYAGAPFQVGREGQAAYGESAAGFYARRVADGGFNYSTDGVTPNNLYPVKAKPALANGAGDGLIQPISYRFPICTAADRLPFPTPPGGYVASKMDQVVATLVSKNVQQFTSVLYVGGDTALQNNKFVINASQSNLFPTLEPSGVQGGYPNGTPIQRQAVLDEVRSYTLHLLYALQNDTRVSASLRSSAAAYGLCNDEFVSNPIKGFPNMPYFRETRRLKGQYVVTQNDVYTTGNANNTSGGSRGTIKSDRVGQWNYILDSHAMELYADGSNNIVITGNVDPKFQEVDTWDVPYAALHTDPNAAGHISNLNVPLNFSASSIAWMTARLEPNFAQLGEATGEAAMIAAEWGLDIASVPYDRLSRRIGSPINTVAPAINVSGGGSATVGSTLGGDVGSWLFDPTTFGVQWARNGVNISGATSATYTTVAADQGTTITRTILAGNTLSTARAVSAGILVQ